MPGALQLASVGPEVSALSVLAIVEELAYIFATVVVCEGAVAVSKVVFEVSFVSTVFWICSYALAFALVFDPVAVIVVAFRPSVLAFAVLFVKSPLAYVLINAVFSLPSHFAITGPQVVRPSANIDAAIVVSERPLAVLVSLHKLTLIFRIFRLPIQGADTLKLVFLEVAVIRAAVGPSEFASAMLFVFDPLSRVDRSVSIVEGALTMSFVCLESARVIGTRLPSKSALAVLLALVPLAVVLVSVRILVLS